MNEEISSNQSHTDEVDQFKLAFKKYKRFDGISEKSSSVIDFSDCEHLVGETIQQIKIDSSRHLIHSPIASDIRDVNELKLFSLKHLPGLLVIPQLFTKQAAQRWFHHFLNELPITCSTSLKANIPLPPSSPVSQSNLRWMTFGLHHNWDTKEYDTHEVRSEVPELVTHLCQYVRHLLALDDFKCEAGIINYYNSKSTLCPHTDHSEPNQSAPLLSVSLGSSALFLIGGKSKSHLPIYPLLLRDGDVLIMSSQSRQSYHAVAKVMCSQSSLSPSSSSSPSGHSNEIIRINLNMRQVF